LKFYLNKLLHSTRM